MRWKLGQNHQRRPTSPKEDVFYKIVISLSQKEDKKTATTTSAVHTWTAFRYYGRSWARQLFDPTGALLATLTGALHRGCTAAPTPKLLPARGRVQGFMEAYWTNFLEEFNFCLPDDGSWKNLHSVKFGCLKRCLWWGVSVIIVDKRNQKLISCKTNLKHKDTLTSSGSFVLENPTTFYQTHCCCTGCFIQLTIFQQNEKSSGIFLLLLKSVFECISSVFTQIYPVFVSLLSILLQHTFKITVIFCCSCLVSKIRHTCSHKVLMLHFLIFFFWKYYAQFKRLHCQRLYSITQLFDTENNMVWARTCESAVSDFCWGPPFAILRLFKSHVFVSKGTH